MLSIITLSCIFSSLKQFVNVVKNLLLLLRYLRNEVGKLGVSELIGEIGAYRFDLLCVGKRVFDVKKLFG
jgi:hypothetical protein